MFTESEIYFAFWVGIGALVLALLLVGVAALLRTGAVIRKLRERRHLRRWEAVLHGQAPATAVLDIPSSHALLYLRYWNHAYEALDANRPWLSQVAERTGLAHTAVHLLGEPDLAKQRVAMKTLGHLQAESAWETLSALVQSSNPYLAFSALETLFYINPERAEPLLIKAVPLYPHWPLAAFSRMLDAAGERVIKGLIQEAEQQGHIEALVQLFRCLERTGAPESIGLLDWLAEHASQQRTLLQVVHFAVQDAHRERIVHRLRESRQHIRTLTENLEDDPRRPESLRRLLEKEPPWVRQEITNVLHLLRAEYPKRWAG